MFFKSNSWNSAILSTCFTYFFILEKFSPKVWTANVASRQPASKSQANLHRLSGTQQSTMVNWIKIVQIFFSLLRTSRYFYWFIESQRRRKLKTSSRHNVISLIGIGSKYYSPTMCNIWWMGKISLSMFIPAPDLNAQYNAMQYYLLIHC